MATVFASLRRGKGILGFVAVFLGLWFLPIGAPEVERAVGEGLRLTQAYAREHVLLCLLPALLIAGAVAAFVDKASVLRYLGPRANKVTAYGVGATSGCVLAVCSCTVLPLFAGIHRMGAGFGPAVTFLYAGPAINVLAVILTARILGAEIGLARAVSAVVFAVVIGLVLGAMFDRKKDNEKNEKATATKLILPEGDARPLGQLATLFGAMIAVLVFANWSTAETSGVFGAIGAYKWQLTAASAVPLVWALGRWFGFPRVGLAGVGGLTLALALALPEHPQLAFAAAVVGLCAVMPWAGELGETWWAETWGYTKLIAPLLVAGVFVAGFLLGTPETRGLVPPEWVQQLVGGNGLLAVLGASVVGAFMYFATLTEVPILQGLIGAGMGKGPALALLLAGPALSLPNMLVLRGVLGTKKTLAYVVVVVIGSTVAGLIYGAIA